MALALSWAAAGPPASLSAQSQSLEGWLRNVGQLANSDMRELRRGTPVVQLLDSPDDSELGILGAVRVATTPAQLIALANRPAELLSDQTVVAVGEVHIPPRVQDFSRLQVPSADVRELGRCRPGSCKVKVAGPFMEGLAAAARRTRSESLAAVTARVRRMLFEYSDQFVVDGLSSLPAAVDKPTQTTPLEAAAPLRALYNTLFGQSQVLTNHMRRYPLSNAAGVTDRLAWTVEDVGLRTTIRLLHLTLIQPPDVPAVDAIVGIEQLYASHYLLASTTFLSLVTDASVTGEPARYLILMTRYRFDEEVDGMSRTALERSTATEHRRKLLRLQQRLRP
ncbi:MAG: hypothetical protein ACR2QM_01915 [Longimicrobiales bacterium]